MMAKRFLTTHPCIPLLAAALLLVGSGGCSEKGTSQSAASGAAPGSAPAALTPAGKLVFSDDFERDQLGPNWVRGKGENGKGQWRLEDGGVVGVDLRNDPLWLKQPLPEKVRVEFDIQALSSVGDLKVEIFGDGINHASGYILIYGGWTNTLDVMARLDEHGKDRKQRETRGVVPGHVYPMAVERTGSTVRWFVHGQHFMTYEDDAPLVGEGHRYFALNNWSAPVRVDNVKVYDLGAN